MSEFLHPLCDGSGNCVPLAWNPPCVCRIRSEEIRNSLVLLELQRWSERVRSRRGERERLNEYEWETERNERRATAGLFACEGLGVTVAPRPTQKQPFPVPWMSDGRD